MEKLVELLAKQGIECDYQEYVRFRHYLFDRYKSDEGFKIADWSVE